MNRHIWCTSAYWKTFFFLLSFKSLNVAINSCHSLPACSQILNQDFPFSQSWLCGTVSSHHYGYEKQEIGAIITPVSVKGSGPPPMQLTLAGPFPSSSRQYRWLELVDLLGSSSSRYILNRFHG